MTCFFHRVTLLLLFFSVAACSSSPKKDHGKGPGTSQPPLKYTAGKTYENLSCKTDPSVTYAVYFPSTWKEGARLPLFLAFDPEGSGLLPVTKYRELADKYGFILMGSNNSKNNQQLGETDRIVGNLREEIATQLPCDPAQLYLTGFSGGSRIASIICMFQQGIKGMIGCGAGFAYIQQPAKYTFDYFGIVGNADFNLQEMIQLDEKLQAESYHHYLAIFKGKHEWPPAEIMELGIIWQMKGNEDPLFAGAIGKAQTGGQIFSSALFGKEIRDKELARQKEYVDAFLVKDLSWWKKEVSKLRKTEGLSQDIAAMNQRLLSYLSLVCYSQSSRALQGQNKSTATYSVRLYELVDPDNPEVQRMKGELAKMP